MYQGIFIHLNSPNSMKRILLILLVTCASRFSLAQNNINLLGHLSYPGATCAGIWQYVDSLNNEYAIVGASDRVSIVDVTNPAAPSEVFSVPALPGESSLWREVKTYDKYAYAVSEGGGGLIIIDLSDLPASISAKHYYGDGVIANLLKTAHTIAVTDGFAYIFGTGNGLANGGAVICDLADPWNPLYVGQYNLNYIHDGYIRNDTLWAGEIYAGQFSVIDVSNKTAPVLIATQQTPGQFCHNTWLSDNSSFLFTTDEIGGEPLGSFDITDLSNIQLIDEFYTDSMPQQEVHNVRVLNDYLINPSYGSQLVICDGSRPDNIVEIGQYPTGSFLCWDASPYLPSGNIIATDVNGGLFVFQANYNRACFLEGTVVDSISGLPLNNVQVNIIPQNKIDHTDLSGEFKTGIIFPAIVDVEFKKAGYITKVESGVQLLSGQVANINVQLAPFSLNGSVVNATTSQLISGASVLLTDGNDTILTTSDANGVFGLSSLPSGNISYHISKWGYISECGTVVVSPGNPVIITLEPGYFDDFTTDLGWTVNSTASTGIWERAIPFGTSGAGGIKFNPDTDSPNDCLGFAFVTGNAPSSNPTADDVDLGYTILQSPAMDLSTYNDPYLSFDRWYSSQPNIPATAEDTLFVYISDGINSSVVYIANLSSPGQSTWYPVSVSLNGPIPMSGNMQITIRISDYLLGGNGLNILECGFDNFRITNGPQQTLEISENNFFQLFPNPTEGEFELIVNSQTQKEVASVTVSDITGRTITSFTGPLSTDRKFSVDNLNPGVYLITVTTLNNQHATERLVIN